MDKKKTIIWVTLLLLVVCIGIGYAVISSINLTILGQADAEANQGNFVVEFSGEPVVSDSNKVIATIEPDNKLSASIDVTKLSAKGDYVTATYTIENKSADLSAALSAVLTKNTNEEFFNVTYKFADDKPLLKGETTTIEVRVELIKTPITQDESTDITVTITADPQQP